MIIAIIAFMGIGFLSIPDKAHSAFLYWASTPLKTASVKIGYSFAYDAMRDLNFQNIRQSPMEVTGSRGSVYAAITCIRTTPQVTAIVMVVGDNAGEALRARNDLRDRIKIIQRID
jgi:hypothetical protein